MSKKVKGSPIPPPEHCAICNCRLHRRGRYAEPTPEGRAHATAHHVVPERFFGRSRNRRGTQRDRLFPRCPWGYERRTALLCYDCHEELVHNPVFLPEDLAAFKELALSRGLSETRKSASRKKLARRVILLHEVIALGLQSLLLREPQR